MIIALVWVVSCVPRCYALCDAHSSCVTFLYTLGWNWLVKFKDGCTFWYGKTLQKWAWLECQLLHNVQPRPGSPHGYRWHNQLMFQTWKHFTLSSTQTALLSVSYAAQAGVILISTQSSTNKQARVCWRQHQLNWYFMGWFPKPKQKCARNYDKCRI